ncbi:hypothetical protein Baya_16789 [Bagarius yarrelli]|uniref:Uncharacterized protein n=1 Tax=Bagarius yarrelli TaxID=175774 RepID=A0A556VWU9_BAGYA|nr:hypothetical protein Baya_16789 [Bagarius yarrelli]
MRRKAREASHCINLSQYLDTQEPFKGFLPMQELHEVFIPVSSQDTLDSAQEMNQSPFSPTEDLPYPLIALFNPRLIKYPSSLTADQNQVPSRPFWTFCINPPVLLKSRSPP